MFRRLPETLPKDPIIPADLTQLGYFVNNEDQIKQLLKPNEKYKYLINKNERVNEVLKEAMNTCTRAIVSERLASLDLMTIRLPLGSSATEPHVPILASKDLKSRKRVIVLLGERSQDLGIFSYRVIGDKDINAGSAVDFCNAILNTPQVHAANGTIDEPPGIIITNPGQLLWYRGGNRAVTYREWANLPRTTAVHEPFKIDRHKNTVPENRNYEEHVNYIFDHVLPCMTSSQAKFEIIGLEYPGRIALQYLANNWQSWQSRITGICFGTPQHSLSELKAYDGQSKDFSEFVRSRCRAYNISSTPIETPIAGPEHYGCNVYSSGEPWYAEDVLAGAWRSMLDWFNLVASSTEYTEGEYTFVEDTGEEAGQ